MLKLAYFSTYLKTILAKSLLDTGSAKVVPMRAYTIYKASTAFSIIAIKSQ